ncbi:MAG: hypothetical protein ACR2PF_05850, partial [Rhizobiaceae bacterium]
MSIPQSRLTRATLVFYHHASIALMAFMAVSAAHGASPQATTADQTQTPAAASGPLEITGKTIDITAATGLTVNIARADYASDNAYKAAFIAAFDDAVRGTGTFAGATSGSVRRINIKGIVQASFETGTSSLKTGLPGRVEVIGDGVATTRWFANQHTIHGGDRNRNVDLTLDGFDISMGSVDGALPATLISSMFIFTGRYRVVSLGVDRGFNKYSFSMGGTRDYDLKDMRNVLRKAVLNGVSASEYTALVPKNTVIGVTVSGSLYETRVEDKQDLGSGRVRLWINNADSGVNRNASGNRWHQFFNAVSPGQTVNWAGGSARLEAREESAGRPASFSKAGDNDYKELHFYGLAYNAGEARWAADDVLRFSGVMDGLGSGDFFKIKANPQGRAPKKIELKRGVSRYVMPGTAAIGAHSDVMQVFENSSFIGNQTILLEVEDFFFGLGEGALLGTRPQGFGSWGNHVGVKFAPGSYIRNSFFDHNAVGTALQKGLGANLTIDRYCLVASGYSGHHGFSTFIPTLYLEGSSVARNSIVSGIKEKGAQTSNIRVIGSGRGGGYRDIFPNWNDNHGSSVEELLHRYSPAQAHLDKCPITPDGEFIAWNGETLWTKNGAPDGSSGGGEGSVNPREPDDNTPDPGVERVGTRTPLARNAAPDGPSGVGEGPVDPQEPDDNTPDPGVERDGALTPQVHDGD